MNSILADAKLLARELLRLLDDTPADYAWAERVGLADGTGLYCAMCGDWWVGVQCISKKTRGQVRCLAKVFGRELKEGES